MKTRTPRPERFSRLVFPLVASAIVVISIDEPAPAQSTKPAVFVCHNIATSPQYGSYPAVSSFTVNPDGTLDYVGNYFTNDNPQAISVAPDGRFLAVSHGTASSTTEDLLVFRIEPDASLTMWAVYPTPDSPLDVEWISNDLLACMETKVSGTNRVHVYRFVESNPMYSRLTLIDSEVTGVFTAYLQRHPSGAFLYASDSDLYGASLLIRTFAVNPDGTLTFVADVNTASYPLDMTITHDGTKLYSAGGIGLYPSGDPHRVHGFNVDPGSGGLAPMDGTPFYSPGQSPAHVAVTGDDQILLVGHGGDGDIRSFLISPEDGYLTDTGWTISIGSQGDIGAICTMNQFLFATRRYGSSGPPSGLLVFRITNEGDFIQIGDTIDTHGSASDAVAAWSPPPILHADINNDGQVDQLDITAFVAVLMGAPLDPAHVERSDLNGDDVANGLDMQLFTSYFLNPLLEGACCALDLSCTILPEEDCLLQGDATWIGAGTTCSECPMPPPIITVVYGESTYCNSPGWQAYFTIVGANFSPLATVKLTQVGQADLTPTSFEVLSSDTIVAIFDVGGAPVGLWSLVVTNPDGQSATGPDQYLIQECP